jgi:hypothetical protein
VAHIEHIFKRRTEEVDYHHIVVALLAKPSDVRESNAAPKHFVQLGLVLKLRMFALDALQFDGHLLVRLYVGAQVDVTKGTASNLSPQAVFVSHPQFKCHLFLAKLLNQL